jgi:hypothetical protein
MTQDLAVSFVPGDYEVARSERYRVIVERDEYSILLKKNDAGRYEPTPQT